MIYGYCRISTPHQNIDRQVRNIYQVSSDAEIIKEAYTGTTMNRSEWNKLRKKLRTGDTVIFDEVSRMSRDADEGFKTYKELTESGINLIFVKEPYLNTEVFKNNSRPALQMTGADIDIVLEAVNKYMYILAEKQIRIAFEQAQKEVEYLHRRTKEGMQTAKANGKQIGQKKGNTLTTKKSITAKEIIKTHSIAFGGSLNDDDCRKLAEVSRNTYYKYKAEIKDEIEGRTVTA